MEECGGLSSGSIASTAPIIDHMAGVSGTAGNRVNHVCIAMSRSDVEALQQAAG